MARSCLMYRLATPVCFHYPSHGHSCMFKGSLEITHGYTMASPLPPAKSHVRCHTFSTVRLPGVLGGPCHHQYSDCGPMCTHQSHRKWLTVTRISSPSRHHGSSLCVLHKHTWIVTNKERIDICGPMQPERTLWVYTIRLLDFPISRY